MDKVRMSCISSDIELYGVLSSTPSGRVGFRNRFDYNYYEISEKSARCLGDWKFSILCGDYL